MTNKNSILQIIFWIITAADITGLAANISALHYITKPLLLPVLMLLLFTAVKNTPGKNMLLIALFFSWLGDMFLLFVNKNSLFFIFGLASFLTTHVLYIIYFLSIRSNNVSRLEKQPLLIALVLAYGTGLVWLLYPKLGDLKIPVLLYAAVICTMLLCSLHIFYKVNYKAALLYVTGAALFVISDSVLAINKFYQPFTYAGILIMLTYCAAQYNMVNGFIKQHTND